MAFERLSFIDAIGHYKSAYEKTTGDVSVALRIAESYRRLNLPDSSSNWYALIKDSEVDIDPIHYFHYAEALLSLGRPKESKRRYERYQLEASDDRRVVRRLEGLTTPDLFNKESARYTISALPFNTPELEFSPAYYGDGLVFVSSRKRETVVRATYAWDHSDFLDLYYWEDAGVAESHQVARFRSEINSRYHEGPLDFFAGDSMMVFTRSDFHKGKVGKSSKRITKLQLYFAEKARDGTWENIKPFPFNSPEYSTGHPAIAPDGSKLIFASDRPEGEGGTDLYLTEFVSGQWGAPINLRSINTKGDEMFPFLIEDYLFFASNGHSGIGGLDIYRVRLEKDQNTSELKNLGSPINSPKDDFGLIMAQDFSQGFFSSNRGEDKDDIYSFQYLPPAHVVVTGTVKYLVDDTPISDAEVQVLSDQGISVKTIITGDAGDFSALVPRNLDLRFIADRAGWNLAKEVSLNTSGQRDTISNVNVYMQREELFALVAGYDALTDAPLVNTEVTLSKLGEEESEKAARPLDGYHKFLLDPGSRYVAHVMKDGYFTNTDTIDATMHASGTINVEVPLEKIIIGKAIKVENIYYDVNKSNIRPDAAIELNKIVTMLQENPSIRIELSSHTDARGSDVHNLKLSQKRATSAVNYIISQGIASSRIIARGYGESQPVNRCKNGVTCTGDEHQQNRRTEFKVIALLPRG
ncbi:MAG: OmpA family protein [Bacteroidota bacterium]